MRIVLTAIMVMAVALSGCADSGTDSEPTTDVPQDSPGDGNEAAPGGAGGEAVGNGTEAAENLVPELSFTADALNGTAPLVVNFTVDATDDSESLSWVFFVDGNETLTGAEVPATFNHTFEAGNWTAVVQVTDGEHTVEQNLTIDVAAGEVVLKEIGRFEGTARIGYFSHRDADYAIECPGFHLGESGQGCFFAELPAGMAGQPAVYTTSAGSTRLAFWDQCDAQDGSAVGWFEEGNPLDLVVPEGAGCVIAWSANAFDVGMERDFSLVVYG